MRRIALGLNVALAIAATSVAVAETPKLGIDATPITDENELLRLNPAPDYWAFAPFLRPQETANAAELAAVTAAVNGLVGLPERAEEPIPSQADMLDMLDDADLRARVGADGSGIGFAAMAEMAAAAVAAAGLVQHEVRDWRPEGEDLSALSVLREWLVENESSAQDAIVVRYDQGVLTGGASRPHAAVIGAYDPAAGRVLLLDVDLAQVIPYWSSDVKLLEAMLVPDPGEHDGAEGGTGGLVHIRPTEAGG